ncbi:hypothetical protein BFP70_05665 [Thioclava sp. SK-1]|nr:hypothetical protein BFP70_05665 [Thioclava sp. SK-1]
MAAEQFLAHGFNAVSLDTLIAMAGGSRRNIYERFGGKEGLFTEVVRQLCAQLDRSLAALDLDNLEPTEALMQFSLRSLEIVQDPRTLALHRLMIAEGPRFPELAQAIYDHGHHRAILQLATLIEGWQAAGHFTSDQHAEALAARFVNLLVTDFQYEALTGRGPTTMDAAEMQCRAKDCTQLFFHGACADALL